MSLLFDEYGLPFIVVRDQEQKQRLKGVDAVKVKYKHVFLLSLLLLCLTISHTSWLLAMLPTF
jgi:hypothetical protein